MNPHPSRVFRACRCWLAVLLLMGMPSAWAACSMNRNWQDPHVNMDLGRVVIPPDLPVGATIVTWSTRISQPGTAMSCDWYGGATVYADVVQGQAVPGYSKVFTTGVPGVGIRMSRKTANAATTMVYPDRFNASANTSYTLDASTFVVELIKTAPVTGSGPLVAGQYSSYHLASDPSHPLLTTWVRGEGITIISPSCLVDAGSKNIAVKFGSVPQSSFGGVGTTAAERDFTISLQCQQSPGNIFVRLDATADPSNSPGVLQITQGPQAAKGVGIQVLDARDSRPVSYGGSISAGSSPVGANTLRVPFKARYYQTGSAVAPGDANGTATFTIQYQ
ncbi:fimbrial protein [Frateuria sp. Soil773]|uniref:fimbrial protein n=1 Tax=Frateuria sp. Soil773 TaxID=1736407 RepID=UPI0012F78CA6|nr:fimbrial protein [Frateuria sp. Soil773]